MLISGLACSELIPFMLYKCASGDDPFYMDRLELWIGSEKTKWGVTDDKGWCLSTDSSDNFDKRCTSTETPECILVNMDGTIVDDGTISAPKNLFVPGIWMDDIALCSDESKVVMVSQYKVKSKTRQTSQSHCSSVPMETTDSTLIESRCGMMEPNASHGAPRMTVAGVFLQKAVTLSVGPVLIPTNVPCFQ